MDSIFNYLDYREFLRDYYLAQKQKNRNFSYRYIANKVDMNFSYIMKVFKSKLHITTDKIDKFVKLCKLAGKEKEYFENLVYFSKAKSDNEKQIFFDKLNSLRELNAREVELYQREFYSKWYYTAIWVFLHNKPFEGDYSELAAKLIPHISQSQAEDAIGLLSKLNLIIKNEKNQYIANDVTLTSGRKGKGLVPDEFFKKFILLSSESIDRFSRNERTHYSLTFQLPEKEYKKMDHQLRKLHESIMKTVDELEGTPDSRIYQLNINLFPISE